MLIWILVQAVVNILLALGIFVLWSRLKKPPQDDPRLSKGLQLLQSKISVLEDLSDRTEVQFKQINALMDEKLNQVRKKVIEASDMIYKVDLSMQKSLEVAEIFQDKIPHEEIIERQNTAKYAKAAKMAHQGATIEEICETMDLPEAEVQFIVKVNKDEMRFNESQLPAWVFPETKFESGGTQTEDSLKKIGDEFRRACADFDNKEQARFAEEVRIQERKEHIVQSAKQVSAKIKDSAETLFHSASDVAKTIGKEVSTKTEEFSRDLFNSLEGQGQKSQPLGQPLNSNRPGDVSSARPLESQMQKSQPLNQSLHQNMNREPGQAAHQQPASRAPLSLDPEVARAVADHHARISLSLDAPAAAMPKAQVQKKPHVVGGNPNEEKIIKKVIFPTVNMNDPLR